MSLFGLSPLFLSLLATTFFTSEDGELNVTGFMAFMAILAGVVHLIGAFNLRTPEIQTAKPEPTETPSELDVENEVGGSSDERTPLIRSKSQSVAEVTVITVEQEQTVYDLLKDPSFWLLAVSTLICLGSVSSSPFYLRESRLTSISQCEMVISNIGSIVVSLPSDSSTTNNLSSLAASPSASAITSTQVRLISLANTFSRLLVGPLADFVSPAASSLPCGTIYYSRKHRVSRVAFIFAASALLVLTYAWMEFGVMSREKLWVVRYVTCYFVIASHLFADFAGSIGTGVAYGAFFTALPGIISSVSGLPNLGRNFGIITYAPFLGTPIFSYLYAFIAAAHADESGICTGTSCWRSTFGISIGAAVLSVILSVVLWKRWKGRV